MAAFESKPIPPRSPATRYFLLCRRASATRDPNRTLSSLYFASARCSGTHGHPEEFAIAAW